MLPHENEPFAQTHIKYLADIRTQLEAILADPKQFQALTPELLLEWASQLKRSERAFYRYQICFKDEQDSKHRYEQQRMEARLQANRDK